MPFEISIDGGAPIDVGDVLSYNVEGLTLDQEYGFRVRARDGQGNVSAWTETKYATPFIPEGTDPYPPSVPEGLAIFGDSTEEMLVTWYMSSDEELYGAENDDDYLGV